MVDILGRTIYRGSYITYSTRQGSNLGVHVGRVESVDDEGNVKVSRIDLWNKGLTRPSPLSQRSRVTLIDQGYTRQLDELFFAVETGGLAKPLSSQDWHVIREWLWTPASIPNIEGVR